MWKEFGTPPILQLYSLERQAEITCMGQLNVLRKATNFSAKPVAKMI
jgi:hypothetical protein